jgi:hypothetical protein
MLAMSILLWERNKLKKDWKICNYNGKEIQKAQTVQDWIVKLFLSKS